MSEKKEPAEIVQMLNEYFEVMVDVLFRAQGHARQVRRRRDHGAVRRAGRHARRAAVRGALRHRDADRRCASSTARALAEGLEPIQIGIGINTGRVITGAIGSSRRCSTPPSAIR